ncbi:MAG: AAA family ATPase, partial [Kiritimatiellae bacterium]|nr:AAA family ATPase [Kiritimatiellia bacterium]
MNRSHIPGFHGRQTELERLRGLFDRVSGGSPGAVSGGPRMAILVAESGLGKTRLIQALYQQLSRDPVWDPPDRNYWPDQFQAHDEQLRVNPLMKDHRSGGPPRFLWLGMRWPQPDARNETERRCPLTELRSALDAHVETALAQSGRWKSLVAKASTIARSDGPGDAAELGADLLLPFGGLLVRAAQIARELVRDQAGLGRNATERLEAAEEDVAEDLLGSLRLLFQGRVRLPTVVWLDDAQWIDERTLRFLHRLWDEAVRRSWPLLVVVTHWEREWALLAAREDRESTLARYDDASIPDAAVIRLGPAEERDLGDYLDAMFAGLTPAQRSLLLVKASGNFLSMVENVGYLRR